MVAREDAPFVVRAEIHPRALLSARHRVEQLDLEVLRDLDALDRRGLVLADGRADASGAVRLFLRLRRVGGVERRGEDEAGEQCDK